MERQEVDRPEEGSRVRPEIGTVQSQKQEVHRKNWKYTERTRSTQKELEVHRKNWKNIVRSGSTQQDLGEHSKKQSKSKGSHLPNNLLSPPICFAFQPQNSVRYLRLEKPHFSDKQSLKNLIQLALRGYILRMFV